MNILCRFGRHTWGELTYQSAQSCVQVRTCRRCGTTHPETRVVHNWGTWRLVEQCYQERTCRRCGRREARTVHTWSAWRSLGDSSHLRQCRTCGVTVTEAHSFSGGHTECPTCGGSGENPYGWYAQADAPVLEPCPACGGTGYIEAAVACVVCGASK